MAKPTVSGRTYTRTRARGFAPWRPQQNSRRLVEQIRDVLAEYSGDILTARQVFYRLVGAHGYEKTESGYDRLIETLNRARRAGLIPMRAIRDDGGIAWTTGGYDNPGQFWDGIRDQADAYEHDLTDGQPVIVETWIEAQGMAAMVARVAREYGVSVYSSGGFDSVTVKHAAAQRIARRDRPTRVLHIGDHDPSGLSILDAAAEDVLAFTDELGPPARPRFTRLAVTSEQITRYQLPTAPQKTTDRRGQHMRATVQVEALAPTDLITEIRAGLEAAVDLRALAAAKQRSQDERAQVQRAARQLPGGDGT